MPYLFIIIAPNERSALVFPFLWHVPIFLNLFLFSFNRFILAISGIINFFHVIFPVRLTRSVYRIFSADRRARTGHFNYPASVCTFIFKPIPALVTQRERTRVSCIHYRDPGQRGSMPHLYLSDCHIRSTRHGENNYYHYFGYFFWLDLLSTRFPEASKFTIHTSVW